MTNLSIETVSALEIVDCRLEPTLRVTVRTESGASGTADVPCGRSTGAHEAVERRDGGSRFNGKGVADAVEIVNEEIEPTLAGRDVTDQRAIDRALVELDGTSDRSRLGGNTMTGVSLATAVAAASATDLPLYRYLGRADAGSLPVPLFDVIEGGELAESGLAFQEHQLIPVGADSFSEALRMSAETYSLLGDLLEERYDARSRNVGVEGGYTPPLSDPRDAFDVALEAAERAGYGGAFALGIDAAATHFYDDQTETYAVLDEPFDRGELVEFYLDLVDAYPLVSIEDPLEEDDFAGTAELTEAVDAQIVGDDLFTTNSDRLRSGIERGAGDALLLKVNQVGTLTEALEAADLARRNGYDIQVSERSGQTPDTWLAELAVGLSATQIKTGVTRGERTEQYNRLLEIERDRDTLATLSEPPWS
ncbi:phosphopyruvate hydratase [Halopenitus sp. H-Gu1]|uniref:phosphopyruvate hydratase n=1 Tax=Halopenitus sp. H-Gu1 TaxID=3242697 RepID=UPI00359EDA30